MGDSIYPIGPRPPLTNRMVPAPMCENGGMKAQVRPVLAAIHFSIADSGRGPG